MWDNVLGHKQIKDFLQRCLTPARAQALLFCGVEGLGKRKLALLFAKTLLCRNLNGNDYCDSCRLFDLDREMYSHPDFILVEPEEGSKNIKIEQIKNVIQQAALTPAISENKVCIIDPADKMTVEAANSFLKLLEEPPPGWVIILIASSETKILATILSRVIKLKFYSIPHKELTGYLVMKNIPCEKAEVLSRLSEGSVGLALKMNEQNIFEYREHAISLLDSLPLDMPGNYFFELKWIENYTSTEIILVVKLLYLLIRDMLFIKLNLHNNIYNLDLDLFLTKTANSWNEKALKVALAGLDDAYQALVNNTARKAVMEGLIYKLDLLRKR